MNSRPAAMVAHVARTAQITPHMLRITLTGPELDRFSWLGGDQVVRVFFPQPGQVEPVLPQDTDWWTAYQAVPEDVRPALRNYTVRRFDAATRELDIDFVLHGDEGPASAWALRARPGDIVGVCHDVPSAPAPADTDWQLLVADETALPALSVLVEQLPAGVRALAFVEIGGPEDELELITAADVDVVWLHRGDRAAGRSDVVLRALTAAQVPAGQPYAWIAGESGMVKDVRRHLVRERGVDRKRVRFCGYWVHRAHDTEGFRTEMADLYAEQLSG